MKKSYGLFDYVILIGEAFIGALKRLLPFMFIYFMAYTPGLLFVYFINKLTFLFPTSVVTFIVKAYLCVMPSIPTAIYLRCCESETIENTAPDMCFVIWAITIFAALNLL